MCRALAAAVFALSGAAAAADNAAISEDAVKAAYLVKFLGYVQWPPAALPEEGQAMRLGVMGSDEVAAQLARLAEGRTINSHRLEVVLLRPGEAIDHLQLLFVGSAASALLHSAALRAQQSSALLVSDTGGALDQGSDINFVTIDSHVRFEVDLAHAESAGLKLGSGLLSVAMRVRSTS